MNGRALVTGASGFAGSHLVAYLLAETACAVTAQVRSPERAQAVLPPLGPRLAVVPAELTDRAAVARLVAEATPNYAFLLAGQPATARSWEMPEETFRANVLAQMVVLDALVAGGRQPRVLAAGSADAYGLVRPEELPIAESQPFRPTNPYGVSKVAQELMGQVYFVSRGLPVVRARAFNHLGPRQSADFVASAIARQLARIAAGRAEPVLRVGNTSPRRDFTDVRDVVRAYALLLERGTPGEVYNVGSGVARSVQDLIAGLLDASGLAVRVEQAPELVRPVDVPEMRCDNRKLVAATGWAPRVPFAETLHDVWLDWRERVAHESDG
ncbi:MAG: GDP-mannose 4,6-dehydratase [Chloroflexi bacterium]|nr:GDP-mannose 4,6-dehydratase [Chloroflexota bacterium]